MQARPATSLNARLVAIRGQERERGFSADPPVRVGRDSGGVGAGVDAGAGVAAGGAGGWCSRYSIGHL